MALFVASPWVLYFTGWYEATLGSPWLHDLTRLYVVAVGALFFWTLIGLDPLPGRPAYPLRMLAVFATMPMHAWLGVTVMSSTTPFAQEWYEGLTRTWGPTLIEDQRLAGGILWASGDVVGVIFRLVLFVQWVRASEREAEREDRRLDRLEARARLAAPGPRQADR